MPEAKKDFTRKMRARAEEPSDADIEFKNSLLRHFKEIELYVRENGEDYLY
jgi:hypothetical protein